MNQLELATKIANEAHLGQFRNDGITPYIVHPEQVADQLDGELTKAIAMLHDVIEDCEGYDREVLTHPKYEPYDEYIARIIEAGPLACTIKLADMIVNLADDPTEKQKKKYTKYTKLLLANI